MEDAEVLTLHATSSGLAVLAFCPPDFVDRVLARPLDAHTAADRDRPRRDPRRAGPGSGATGVADSVGGFEVEVHSHAAPVFDVPRHCIGAMAVAAPVARMTTEAPRA